MDAIKQSVKEVEDLSELIEKSFGLTHDLILGRPRRLHKINVNQGTHDVEDADDEPVTTEAGEADEGVPPLSERNSDLALNILKEYGLLQRYTEEKCLHKIERLRKHVVAREQAEEREQQKERAAKGKQTSFSLETGGAYSDPKPPMHVSIFNPSLVDTGQSSSHQKAGSAESPSPKNEQAPLEVKEFRFALEDSLSSQQPSPTRNSVAVVPGVGAHATQESAQSPSGKAPLIPSFSQKKFKSKPGSPKPVMLQPSQSSNPAAQSYG